jgi:hypothetical protein
MTINNYASGSSIYYITPFVLILVYNPEAGEIDEETGKLYYFHKY